MTALLTADEAARLTVGTTLEAAQAVGRHAIGIDLDARNADLARDRVGMFLIIDERATA